jgi:membrane protein DedA with SNARE-associated domain
MIYVVQFVSDHKNVAAALLILLMAAESAPVVGFFIPGVLLLPALGTITGTENWPFWTVYAYAVAGAVLGDGLGYWLGWTGRAMQSHWLHKRHYLLAIKIAEDLVAQRGVLALFFGRFAWFIHPVVPLAAGLLGIRPRLFFIVDSVTISLWVWVYMSLGRAAVGAWLGKNIYVIGIISLVVVVIVTIVTIRKGRTYLHRWR